MYGSYGGVIYGYNNDSIRLWRPANVPNAYIANVGQDWGNGVNQQASRNADVIIRVWSFTAVTTCSAINGTLLALTDL
jgi:hypothetical protein